MFKRIVSAFAAISLVVSPVLAKSSYSSGGSYSRSSYSSSYSRPSYSSSSYSRPAYSAPRYSSTPPQYSSPSRYTSYAPSRYTSGSSYRTSGGYARPAVQNHYYNNSFGHPMGSPWFWMWAMDRHQPQTVVVAGAQHAPVVQGGDPGMYAPQVIDNGPGFFMTIFWGIFNLLVLVTLIVFLIWAFRKVRNWYRSRK